MSDRLKQFLGFIIGIPICLAIGVSLVLLIMRLSGGAQTAAIIGLLVVAISCLVWYAVRNAKAGKMVEGLLDVLYKETNPEKFIAESEAALEKTKNRALKNTLLLNLAVGYEAAGKFSDAIRVMKEMHIGAADKTSKAMFYMNAASFYAENGAVSEAGEAYNLGRPFFEKAEKDIPFSYLRLTRGLIYFAEGQYEDALDAFEKARGKGFEERHTMTKLQLFEARALAKLGKIKEAKAMYGKVIQKKTYPYLLSCAREEMAVLSE